MSDADETENVVDNVARLFVQFPDDTDGEVVERTSQGGVSLVAIELAIAFLPCAFGRALIREQHWMARLPDEFRARSRSGKYVRFRLSENPIYKAAAELAEHQRLARREWFAVIAARSAEINAINKAWSAGSDVTGGVFSPVFLVRVDAEDVRQRKLHWWQPMRWEPPNSR